LLQSFVWLLTLTVKSPQDEVYEVMLAEHRPEPWASDNQSSREKKPPYVNCLLRMSIIVSVMKWHTVQVESGGNTRNANVKK